MSGVIRGQEDRRRDRLELHSPMHRSRNSSPQPPHLNEPCIPAAGALQHVLEVTSAAADGPWPSVAKQITTPPHSPSPAIPAMASSVSPTLPAARSVPVNQLAINNTSNVNHNAPGGSIVNNIHNVTQVITRDQAAEDLHTIEKGLGKHHVARALYDAQPLTGGCMEGTRVEVLEDTEDLLTSPGGAHIVWIAGMAGTGKTSIALTLSRRLIKLPMVLLGGTFFCSRSAGVIERTDAQRIIPTLATVLARRLPAYARALAVELREDPDLASKEVNAQVEYLLLKPLKSVRTRDRQIVLVIDALDECRDKVLLAELINALADFEYSPLSKPGNRKRLTELVEGLADLIKERMDDQAKSVDNNDQARRARQNYQDRLAKLINMLAEFRATLLNKCDNQAKLESFAEALACFMTTPLNNPIDQTKLEMFISRLTDFRSTPPVKFLLTSRPEMHIRDTAITDKSLSSILQLHMVDENVVTSDIRLYVQKSLEKSCKPLRWYTDRDIDDLAALSAGLFIFASTVLAYILRRKDAPGRLERLRTVKLQAAESVITTDPLDKMYSLVLMQASDPSAYEPAELDETRRIVAIILSTRSPFTINSLAELIGVSTEHLRGALDELHAVISVPDQDEKGELRALHASFGDYIFTRAAAHIRIEKSLGHDELARACLRRMAADDLSFNISRSRSSYEPNPKTHPGWIAPSLLYACLNWTHHIDRASEGSSFDEIIVSVLRVKLLFLLEVLSLMGEVDRAAKFLRLAGKNVTSSQVSQFVRDADSFVTSSRKAIELSAPHIYISAMAFVPKTSLIYQAFHSNIIGIPEIEIFGFDSRSSDRSIGVRNVSVATSPNRPMDGHTGEVYAIALSPDGRLIASASADGSARVWNIQTCRQMYPPLLGHKGKVRAVAFSPDGQWIATGADDKTSRLWYAQTGQFARIQLRGHMDSVTDIAFSPTGLHLASGSYDGTVRVWDVSTKQPAEILQIKCLKPVDSVAYLPSGAVIAVGGEDGLCQTFDDVTGREIQNLQHSTYSDSMSLAFSPDGARLVTASSWDVIVFEVQSDRWTMNLACRQSGNAMWAVAYSPDGQSIACGTAWCEVLLWGPDGGNALESLPSGHAHIINSVIFSSDGRFLITSSWDSTIRILDLEKIRSLADRSDRSPLTALALARYERKEGYYQATGWLVSPSGQLLLWVPPEYRGFLEIGSHSRIIATHCAAITAGNGILHQGEEWVNCWHS